MKISKSSNELLVELIGTIQEISKNIDGLNIKMKNIETKIENITTQITRLKTNSKLKIIELPSYIPTKSWKEWIKTIDITREQMYFVYRNTIIDGLKECLKDYLTEKDILPICCVQKKELYIYNEERWECIQNEHLKDLMREIWKKMMLLSLNEDDTITEEMQDENKKKICDMRKKIEEKHKDLQRWIISQL
jgi:hypothetical protein